MIQFFAPVLALGAIASAAVMMSVEHAEIVESRGPQLAERIEIGFQSLQAGYAQYVLAHAAQPALMQQITPAYAFLPPAPEGMQWSFGGTSRSGEVVDLLNAKGPGGAGNANACKQGKNPHCVDRWVCLSGVAGPDVLEALHQIKRSLEASDYFVSSQCGSFSNTSMAPMVSNRAEATIAATFIVDRTLPNS